MEKSFIHNLNQPELISRKRLDSETISADLRGKDLAETIPMMVDILSKVVYSYAIVEAQFSAGNSKFANKNGLSYFS